MNTRGAPVSCNQKVKLYSTNSSQLGLNLLRLTSLRAFSGEIEKLNYRRFMAAQNELSMEIMIENAQSDMDALSEKMHTDYGNAVRLVLLSSTVI